MGGLIKTLIAAIVVPILRTVAPPLLKLISLVINILSQLFNFGFSIFCMIPGSGIVLRFLAWFATEHRSWFIVFILPASLAFDLFFYTRAWMVRTFFSDPKLHAERVADIQRQIREAVAANPNCKLCTARPGWESITIGMRSYKAKAAQISIHMYDILELNTEENYVHVEPMVNMGQLSHFLVPRGYTIPVLPEMDDLTIGGLFMGVGIETSSHKYGLFNDTVIEATIVTSSGELITCSREENREVFDALPWSYGTLGFLVDLKVRVVPSQPFLRIDYIPCTSRKAGLKIFEELSLKQGPGSPDFVESLMYNKDEMVVMPAYWTSADQVRRGNKKDCQVNDISWWWKDWFYVHVEKFLTAAKKEGGTGTNNAETPFRSEYIPIRAYFHRHTKSIFWELEQILPAGRNDLFRFLVGWAMPPKVAFLKLTQTEAIRQLYEKSHVCQDMLVPIDETDAALTEFHEAYNLYPLWICPYRQYDYASTKNSPGHRCFLRQPEQANEVDAVTGEKFELYVDLGAYGTPQAVLDKKPFDHIATGRRVEDFVQTHRGFQMLYADVWMPLEEFHVMFDHSHYEAMKSKLDPNRNFPVVFDKVAKKALAHWGQNTTSSKDNNKPRSTTPTRRSTSKKQQ